MKWELKITAAQNGFIVTGVDDSDTEIQVLFEEKDSLKTGEPAIGLLYFILDYFGVSTKQYSIEYNKEECENFEAKYF